jgi:dCTP deaminase
MSTLTGERLRERLRAHDGLVITPLLSSAQVGQASIDVRLGNQFIVFRMHTFGSFAEKMDPRQIQERLVLRFGAKFVLHPGMLALGATLEYVSVPLDLEAQVEGRSSWARLGLEVATASTVEPGFKGTITLELSNVGSVPLELYPGVRIGQLVFHDAQPTCIAYGTKRKYLCAVGPEFSRLLEDEDGKTFRRRPTGDVS